MNERTTTPPLSAAQSEDLALQLEHEFIGIVRREIGMFEALAAPFAQALVRGLREEHGGRSLWIPAPDKSQRDAAIRREFNGTNIKEIMAKFGLSRSRVYQIVGEPAARTVRIGIASPKSPVSPLQSGQSDE